MVFDGRLQALQTATILVHQTGNRFMRVVLFALLALGGTFAFADTAIETETAQLGKQGELVISNSYEYVSGNSGTSGGTLTQFEYGISDRAEILVEPFFYVWDHPDDEEKVDGPGDLEITPSYMVVLEDGWVPAVLVAAKVKVPTGSKRVGGSGKYDYYPYLIFGQHFGNWIVNANVGVNFAAREHGPGFDNQTVWDLEAERQFAGKWTTFWEVYSAEDGVNTASTSLEYQWTNRVNVFGAVARNEDHENIVRFGLNFQI